MKNLGITLHVITDDTAVAAEVMEQLARTAVALTLRDVGVDLNIVQFDMDDEDD